MASKSSMYATHPMQEMREDKISENSLSHAHHSMGTLLARLRPWGEMCLSLSERLKQLIEISKDNAEHISLQIKIIDLERERVLSIIKAIEAIQETRQCAATARKAMQLGQYEEAVVAVEKYLYLREEESIHLATVFENRENGEEVPIQVLERALNDLCELVKKKFDQAVSEGNSKSLSRFFRIFPRIGLEQYGLDRFSEYLVDSLRAGIEKQLNIILESSVDEDKGNLSKGYSLIKLCIRLFEVVAKNVDENEPFVEEVYGSGKMIHVIWKLWEAVDKLAFRILCIYLHHIDLETHVKAAKAAIRLGRIYGTNEEDSKSVDRNDLDLILGQLTLWNQQMNMYFKFMDLRTREALSRLNGATENLTKLIGTSTHDSSYNLFPQGFSVEDGLRKHSELEKKLQEFMNDYLTLEHGFAKSAVGKAMAIDVYDEKDGTNRASNSVDDIFCIFKKCTFRALTSADVDTFCAMSNLVLRILEMDYWDCLFRRASSEDTLLYPSPSKSITSLVCLNNMDISCDYLLKLHKELETEAAKLFAEEGERVLEKIRTCLAALLDAAENFRKHSIHDALYGFFRHYIHHPLRSALEHDMKDIHYLLSEGDYLDLEVHGNSLGGILIASLRKMLLPLHSSLTRRNYECLAGIVLDFLTREFERFILQIRFTALGAVQLDNDIRQLSSFFNSLVGSSICHDRFIRLREMSAVINIDHPSDIVELIKDSTKSPLAWHLTHGQVRQLLTSRIEFSLDDVNKVRL
jgi:conserved oligomeric Golgi complex subunit 4